MVIDESLSKGLKNQFVKMWGDEIKSAFEKLLKAALKIDLSSRNNFPKFIKFHREYFKRLSMAHCVSGSKRKPIIAMVVIHPQKKRYLVKNKNGPSDVESGFIGVVDLTHLWELGKYPEDDVAPSTFFVSDHAVARAYQRSYESKAGEVVDPYVVIKEFSYIPIWAGFFSALLMDENYPFSETEDDPVCPIIPAPNGIFLCKLTKFGPSNVERLIEIRTYVSEAMLSESQKALREVMLNASKNLENSMLCFFPQYHLFRSEQAIIRVQYQLILKLILSKLRTKTSMIADEFTSDDYQAYKFNNFLNDCIKHIDQVAFDQFNTILENSGYDGFIDHIERNINIARIEKRL